MAAGGGDIYDEINSDISDPNTTSEFSIIPEEPDPNFQLRDYADADEVPRDKSKEELETAIHFLKEANAVIQKKFISAENKIKKYSKKLAEVEKSRKALLDQYSKYIMSNPTQETMNELKSKLRKLIGEMKDIITSGCSTGDLSQVITKFEQLTVDGTAGESKSELVERGFSSSLPSSKVAGDEAKPKEDDSGNIRTLKTKLSTYETELLLRRQESDIVHSQLNTLQEELPRLRERVESLMKDLEKEKEKRKEDGDIHKQKLTEMELKVKEYEIMNDQLSKRVKNLTERLRELDDTLLQEQNMKEDYKKRYLKLGTEFEDLKENYEKKVEELEAEVECTKQILSTVNVGTSLPSFVHSQSVDQTTQTTGNETDYDLETDGVPEDVNEDVEDISKYLAFAKEKVDTQNQLLRTLLDAGQMISLPKPLREDKPLSMPMQEVDQHGGPTIYPPDPVSLNLKKLDEERPDEVNVDERMMEASVKPMSELGIRYPPIADQKKTKQQQQRQQHTYEGGETEMNDEDLYGAGRIYQEGVTKAPPDPPVNDQFAFHPRPDELRDPVDYYFDEEERVMAHASPKTSLEESSEGTMVQGGSGRYIPDGQDELAANDKPPCDGIPCHRAPQTSVNQPDSDNYRSGNAHHGNLNQINPATNWQQAEQLQQGYWQQGQSPRHEADYAAGILPNETHDVQTERWRQDSRTQDHIMASVRSQSGRIAAGEEGDDPRECPICYALFPQSISMNDFSVHVNDHFGNEGFEVL
ncbi:uncharacterized protein LOC144447329 [Glandiceps talaboti]